MDKKESAVFFFIVLVIVLMNVAIVVFRPQTSLTGLATFSYKCTDDDPSNDPLMKGEVKVYYPSGGLKTPTSPDVCSGSSVRQYYCTRSSGSYSGMVKQAPDVSCPAGCSNGACAQPSPPCTDNDHDGYGSNCAKGPDCNDNNVNVNPAAVEVCDGIDNNCNLFVDEGVLNVCTDYANCQSYNSCSSCPSAPVEVCNGVDDNCNGQIDEGVRNACGQCGPVPTEICDSIDNNCDGQVDEGVKNACGTCEPVPAEVCDGIDNNCDGQIDEGVKNACGTCGAVPAEVCDGIDNDCDGIIDNGCGNSVGSFFVPSCSWKDGTGPNQCYWQYEFNPTICNSKGCDKLLIFFSGGDMNCKSTGYQQILDVYANDGYVAICAQTFANTVGSQSNPYSKESGRVNEVISNIISNPTIQQSWSGKYLLHSGVSHGATSPIIAMARTSYDSNANWKGSLKTAACYYDGIYDSNAELNFLTTNACDNGKTPDVPIVNTQAYINRYCGVQTLCTDFAQKTADDTIVNVDPSVYDIKDWKLLSCGSGTTTYPCNWDVFPAGQIQILCDKIKSDGTHTCIYKDLPSPQSIHLTCANTKSSECRQWFDTLITQP